MLSTSSILTSSGQYARHGGLSTITMQEATVTLNGVPGTPGGPDFAKTLPGVLAPFGYFDPLNVVEDCAKEEILRFREAELMHGRVAMMATLGFAVQEGFHPLFEFAYGPAAHQLDIVLQDSMGQTGASFLLLVTFMTELIRAKKGWQDPDVMPFSLREEYTPGNLGFDPLGLKPEDAAAFLDMQNKEINNGRLAMIAIAGIVAQECITDISVF